MLRRFSPNAFAFGLASWSWLGTHGKTPRLTTAFGDVFLESLDGWWLLDTIEGTLTLRWANAVEMYAELNSAAGREEILLEDILVEALDRGVRLGDDEVLTFVPHPAASGRLSAETCSPLRFELALSFAGEVHAELLRASTTAPSPILWSAQSSLRAPASQEYGDARAPKPRHAYAEALASRPRHAYAQPMAHAEPSFGTEWSSTAGGTRYWYPAER